MLFKLMLFVIIVQEIIQVSTAKWEILLPNRVLDKQITCQIFNVKIILTQTCTILDGGITSTSHGAITKGWLNYLSNFHSKRRSRQLRTCSCNTYRRQTWRSKTTQLQFVILRCRSISSQACSQRGLQDLYRATLSPIRKNMQRQYH